MTRITRNIVRDPTIRKDLVFVAQDGQRYIVTLSFGLVSIRRFPPSLTYEFERDFPIYIDNGPLRKAIQWLDGYVGALASLSEDT